MNQKWTHKNSFLEKIEGVDFISLNEPSAYETGFAAGKLLVQSRNPAIGFMKKWWVKILITKAYLLIYWKLKRLIVPQEYRDELRGYADATGIPYHRLYFINFAYDVIARRVHGCSTLVSYDQNGAMIIGHNTDYSSFLAKIAVKYFKANIMRIAVPGKRTFTHVGGPLGVIVLDGFNDRGIAATAHAIDGFAKGTPMERFAFGLVNRILLEHASCLEDAKECASSHLPYTSGNTLIADTSTKRTAVAEITPSHVHFFEDKETAYACTNHFRAQKEADDSAHEGSHKRLDVLIGAVQSSKDTMSIEDTIKLLQDTRYGTKRSAPDYSGRSLTNDGTFQSFVLIPAHNEVVISNGDTLPVSLHGEYVKISTFSNSPQ